MSKRPSIGAAFLLGTSTIAAAALIPTLAQAQVTTSSIRGSVQTETGVAVPNATVRLFNTETGFNRTVTTDNNGSFGLRNLSVSGAYDVEVTAPNLRGERVEDVRLSLGEESQLVFQLSADDFADEIIVVGQRQVVADLAIGPNASFGLDTLESVPAINRNINDVIRLDPRISLDVTNSDAINCGGANNRFNSLTLDGVRFNDNFGLNANGYPTERIPFSYDAVEQVSVELAPFGVEYGGFSACNINAVTKSGTNELHGYLFGDYTNDGLRSNSLEGNTIQSGEFDEYRYGIGIGGPIIKDKLFFFAAYEKLEGVNLFDRGPIGSGAVNEVNITQAELDEIVRISNDIYGYDPGGLPTNFDNEDEKFLAKIDWNITDRQRASFTYNYNNGFNIVESDGDLDELEFSNHLYERGAKLNSYSGALYSDWNDNFSTEFRIGLTELNNRQDTVGGTDFG